MNALVNAHTSRETDNSPDAGLASGAPPRSFGIQSGVSSNFAPKEGHHWYVLRITYNRTDKAQRQVEKTGLQWFLPMHYVIKKEIGKKKRILKPLLPNLFFVYATREAADDLLKKNGDIPQVVKYYRDKTKPTGPDGKHPPMTIPHRAMENFIRATATDSDHVRVVVEVTGLCLIATAYIPSRFIESI